MSLDAALEGFGEGLLTPRENDVIGLVLYGHNTQSVAVQLGISADTVKLHRKHAYAKLRVSSQGELFFKFLEHLGLETSE
jgi:DNA-binding CsgD family transcriptional regulator